MNKYKSLSYKRSRERSGALVFLCALGSIVAFALPTTSAADKSMLELAADKGCFICHSLNRDNNVPIPLAPSYHDIAQRYKDHSDAAGYLAARIRSGTVYSEQNWEGDVNMRFMPPNVNVSQREAIELAAWIVSLHAKTPAAADVEHESMLALASNAGCMTCHDTKRSADHRYVPLAPSFADIAERYTNDSEAPAQLVDAILHGTLNREKAWENVNMRFMPPSVALRKEDAQRLVDWILQIR